MTTRNPTTTPTRPARKVGRPRKPDGLAQRAWKLTGFRLPPHELELLEVLARARGLPRWRCVAEGLELLRVVTFNARPRRGAA